MNETVNLFDLVQHRLDRFLESRALILSRISDDLGPFSDFSREFLSAGKRFRASFCYWGWNSIPSGLHAVTPDALQPIISVASALEIFHAAALIHDDIIDRSDTRRGAPSAHRKFDSLHRENMWTGDDQNYGISAALLLGDLLLGWSDELLDEGLSHLAPERGRASRAEFVKMRTEVTAGQYLDILEEQAWSSHPASEHLARAQRVITYKSAKYSIESPLALGALIAGGNPLQLDSLRRYGLPLGIAFQLRDDVLGIFGDSAVTGKPTGDDLREGKRTVLLALTRSELQPSARRIFDELVGDPELDDDQIASLQATIRQSGALDQLERMISDYVDQAQTALIQAPLDATAINQLRDLARTVTRRSY